MLMTLIIGIAFLGCVLLMLLFNRLMQVNADLKLSKHRTKAAGFSDLLNYAALIEDGCVIGKNGSLMAAWLYQGDDQASMTTVARENTALILNRALSRFGKGWMIHVDAARHSAERYIERGRSHFPDVICATIDDERRVFFETKDRSYEGFFVITLTYFPAILAQRKFIELLYDDDASDQSRHYANDILNTFGEACRRFESTISSCFSLQRLKGNRVITEEGREQTEDDLLRWLHFCATGRNHPIHLPDNPMYLDGLIGGQDFWGGLIPKVGDHFIQVVAIDGFPMESYPGMLNALADLSVTYRWSSRFIFMDREEALLDLKKFRRQWKQKTRGFMDQLLQTNSDKVNMDALMMVHDADEAIADLESGLVAQGYYTSVIILMADDRQLLEENALQVAKQINQLGFNARIESVNTIDAYLGSLPGHGVENVRRPIVNTLNLADLLPTSHIWTGETSAPCPFYPVESPPLMYCMTQGDTPFRLNLHVRDVGHTLICGPTGAGKSTLLAMLAAQFRRYPNMKIVAFDKRLSLYPLTKAIYAATRGQSGLHFRLADEEKLSFCPLQFMDTPLDRAWLSQWIESILSLNGLHVTVSQRHEIAKTIEIMAEVGATRLSDFVTTVQDNAIREALHAYTIGGAMGSLLDAEADNLMLSDFTVFETESLMELSPNYAIPVLQYVFQRIKRSLTGDPCVILLDEVWTLLGNTIFKEKIKEWLKELRKLNCLVIMATQSLSDIKNSGMMDVVIESTASKLFLPNVYANQEQTAAIYFAMGLNERQIDIIASGIPKQDYYYVSEKGSRLFQLALGDYALAFVGSSDKDSLKQIEKLEQQYGHDWVTHWLKYKNITFNPIEKAA
jgi:type IV secretion system protein TrbE